MVKASISALHPEGDQGVRLSARRDLGPLAPLRKAAPATTRSFGFRWIFRKVGKRKAPATKRKKEIHPLKSIDVKVDLENSGFPSGVDHVTVINNIKGTLYEKGYMVRSITAFAMESSYPPALRESLSSVDGLRMVWVTRDDGDERLSLSDLSLKEDILQFSLTCQPPSPLLVCTSDRYFVTVLNLVIGNGVQVLLAYDPQSTAKELLDVHVEEAIVWSQLAKGDLLTTPFTAAAFTAADITDIRSLLPRDRPPQIPRGETTSLLVLWDLPTCPLPASVALIKLRYNIEGVLNEEYGYGVVSEMKAYKIPTDSDKYFLSKMTHSMEKGNIKFSIVDPPSPSKPKSPEQDYPDQVMKRDMYMWFLKHPDMPVLLVSNALRFESFLQTLTNLGHVVLLAHYKELHEKLRGIGKEVLDWDLLAGGLQGNKMKEKMKERREEEEGKREEGRGVERKRMRLMENQEGDVKTNSLLGDEGEDEESEYFEEKRNLEDLWKSAFPVGTEWDQLDALYEFNWDFQHLEEALEEGGKLFGKNVFVFGCTEPLLVPYKGANKIVHVPAVVVVESPFPPSDKIGITSVQGEVEEIIPMEEMKMDWLPYIPFEKRDRQVDRAGFHIFTLVCTQRRTALSHMKEDHLKKFEYCLPYFYQPFKEDELEQSTKVQIMFPSEPPVVCEFDWEFDDPEEFADIEEESLTADQKDEFKEFVKEQVQAAKKARDARKKAIEEMSEDTKQAFQEMKFYKFYPQPTLDTPDVSSVKSPFINRYYGKAHEVL